VVFNEFFSIGKKIARKSIAAICLAGISLVVTYIAMDVVYRLYSYYKLENNLIKILTKKYQDSASQEIHIFDKDIGYRLNASIKIERGHPWFSTSWTNSYGHLSKDEYPIEKPKNEYRVAVIGDSFTAAVNSNIHWPDVLQELLNSSPKWRVSVGGKKTRVINFGIDGIGFEAFAEIAQYKVPDFDPDLLIITFISDDILRQIHYKLSPQKDPLKTPEENILETVHLAMKDWEFDRVFPELLYAIAFEYKPEMFSYVRPRIPLKIDFQQYQAFVQRFPSHEAGIVASARAVNKIMNMYSGHVLFVRAPLRDQLAGAENMWDGLEQEVQRRVKDWTYLDLKPYFLRDYDPVIPSKFSDSGMTVFDIVKLPEKERPDVFNLFYYPYDDHYRDYGNVKIGEFIFEYLTTNQENNIN